MIKGIAKKRDSWNGPIMWLGIVVYVGLLLLFGWQTWQFVNFLFPDDQVLAKILTMVSFDVMAALWAIVENFYRFASRAAKKWVQIAWGASFFLSLVASILYLVVQYFFRFHLAVNTTMISVGYGVSLVSLVFNVFALMAWLFLEYKKRHPNPDEFHLYDEEGYTEIDGYMVPNPLAAKLRPMGMTQIGGGSPLAITPSQNGKN